MVSGLIKQSQPSSRIYLSLWKVSDLSSDPNRETLWWAELIYLHKQKYPEGNVI